MATKQPPDVRNFHADFIEIAKDPTASTWKGEYRQQLEFVQPWTGKKQKIFRLRASASELKYLKERVEKALEELQERMVKDCQ